MRNGKTFFGFGRNVFFTGLVSFFMDVSSEMIYPLVPLFLTSVLGVNMSMIGLIEGIAESTASLLKVFSGWFSDRTRQRKNLMLAGYTISTLSRPIMALAGSWQQVLSSRLTDRMGKGIRTAPRDAIIAESTQATHLGRAFSFHRAMDTLGAVVGPAIAFFLLGIFNNDYRTIFWLSMVPGVIAVILIILFIEEKKKQVTSQKERPRLTFKHFDWKVKFFIMISTLFALGNSSDAFLILRAQQVGIPALTIPVVYLVFNLVYSMSAIPAGMAADKFGKKRIILLGFVLFAGLYYGFAVVKNVSAIWVLFGLYGLFMALTEGIQKAFLATIIPPDFKATAFGVYAAAVGLAMLPASLIAGWLWEHVSPAATFYFGAATATLSALLFIVLMFQIRASQGLTARTS
ncbi:MAG: MFS transporter [Proteobacteria bacterium]|nr:MFS transporter [Desulfocapsa sp.]MBU3943111.1 MFS transporter [Pseudomonadota bacterium]MBU3984190.1 MFS transporter [Pseudomonadota bacterium]MBU4028976.1 MFS transporter [Pseudomonadota bacterium]MBU4042137.1 MFS transporter [Pseudomonadota bacterium]